MSGRMATAGATLAKQVKLALGLIEEKDLPGPSKVVKYYP